MNSLETMLVDLVATAESPLYSAYRWLGKQIGRDMSFKEFLSLIEHLVERDVLRLWLVDECYDRTEFFEVPADLRDRYVQVGHHDETYDPFGYSLTLGPKAEVGSEPGWEVDIDFQKGTFELLARDPDLDLEDVLGKLARYFPDVSLIPTKTLSKEEERRVTGRAR